MFLIPLNSKRDKNTSSFWLGSYCLVFGFLCCVLYAVVCQLIFFFFSHGVFSLFRLRRNFTAGELFPEGIINLVALCMMIINNSKNKPTRTSPGLPRSSFAARNSVAFDLRVPRNILRDTPDLTYVQPEGNYYFNNSDTFHKLKPCCVDIFDCLKTPATSESTPIISSSKHKKGKRSTCKTCNMLITTPDFTSNLTGKTYYTESFEPLDCSTDNVVYGIECTLCGLLFVGDKLCVKGLINSGLRIEIRNLGFFITILINRTMILLYLWKYSSSRKCITTPIALY